MHSCNKHMQKKSLNFPENTKCLLQVIIEIIAISDVISILTVNNYFSVFLKIE